MFDPPGVYGTKTAISLRMQERKASSPPTTILGNFFRHKRLDDGAPLWKQSNSDSCPRLNLLTNTETRPETHYQLSVCSCFFDSGMILSAFLLLVCAVFTWRVFPKKQEVEGPHESIRGAEQAYDTLDQVKAALQLVGLESSNLIIGVDFTKSNEWTGKRCFDGRSLHHLGTASQNPYERAIGIIGDTLSGFDEDNKIPCFGFGDTSTHDQDVFRFYRDGRACVGVPEVLQRYREIAGTARLSGPTSLAPIIETAMGVVEGSGYQYHILLIIADGQVPRCSCARCASNLAETRLENYIEERTLQALIHASHFPMSIVLVGVGDGPWDDDLMQIYDSQLQFDNFQFVDFTKIMSTEMSQAEKEEQFTFEALKKIPAQYAAIIGQRISDLAARAPARTPLHPPS